MSSLQLVDGNVENEVQRKMRKIKCVQRIKRKTDKSELASSGLCDHSIAVLQK